MIKGMCKTYSRCGKTCDERFNNIKEDRAMMFLGEKLKQTQSDMNFHNKNSSNDRDLKEVMSEIKTHRERLQTANNSNLSPVFLVQGRDEYYTSIKNHDKVPPCGYYNIETQQLKKVKSIPNYSKKPKSKSKIPKQVIDVPYRITDKLNRKPPTAHLFQLQLPRPGLETLAPQVNEKRFESTKPMPSIFSKSLKVNSPNFSIGTGHNLVLPETKNSRIYNPNYESIWKNTTRPLLEFEKYPERKPNVFQVTDLDYNKKSFKQIDKSVPGVYFEKSTSRPTSQTLPAFMLRTTSRFGLNQITEKTLQHNHFSESQFFDRVSVFSKKSIL
ncbi:hypothetical protein SteCoe_35708 [Stentor coeruleus]|uniref:Uncharacterized protein n=1 Tax=Stentor coeruleus TaxID=5963 RepID=A0A1R2AS05_9CILI|nr:hypothetical protein SteCoe_35708 [Stentor coeruleus]